MFAPGRFLLASLAATCWIPVFGCWWLRPVFIIVIIVLVPSSPQSWHLRGNLETQSQTISCQNLRISKRIKKLWTKLWNLLLKNAVIYPLKIIPTISKLRKLHGPQNMKIPHIPSLHCTLIIRQAGDKSSDWCSGELYVHKVFGRKGLLLLLIIPDDLIWEYVRLEFMMTTWRFWTCEIGTFEEGYWCL